MAKGSAMGLWKGKKGSSVFYSIWNSNNKEKQGIREYRAEVKNPQSDGQADQRARLLPAQRIKGALRDIVSRSFQGVAYGSKSRLEFLRLAMRLKEGYPFVTKGYQEPVPGRYYISKGSLQQISVNYDTDEPGFKTSINIAGVEDPSGNTTVGELSAAILEQNANFVEGDQITIVVCLCSLTSAPDVAMYSWMYYSFYINTNDTTPMSDVIPNDLSLINNQGYLHIASSNDNTCAAAVIHSRLDEDGTYLRSTAQLAVADFMAPFFTTQQAAVTRASYQTKTTQNSTDWPVEDDTRGGGSSVTDGTFTLSGLTGDLAQCNGLSVKVRVNTLTGDPTAVYVSNATDQVLVDRSGDEITYTITGGELGYLNKSQVPALSSLPIVVYG